MAMAQDDQKKKEDPIITGNSKEGFKKFPAQPSMWESLKEGFQTDDTRAELNAIRQRRAKYGS